MKIKTIKISVFRFDPLVDTNHRFKSYTIPQDAVKTALDALLYIRDHIDSTLAFRSSCAQGRCGSCAMHINGKYSLACETLLKNGKNTIRPLAQLPIIKDLMVDMELFWQKYESIRPYLVRHSGDVQQSYSNRKEMDAMIDCILCGACFSACMMTGMNPEFHGPAAYVALNRFLKDERDSIREQRIELVSGQNGVFRCHSMYNCNDACPKNVKPSENILEIKKNIG
jgi:succinate dehydrogenase / fumarate reductase iron-sulfur subunit